MYWCLLLNPEVAGSLSRQRLRVRVSLSSSTLYWVPLTWGKQRGPYSTTSGGPINSMPKARMNAASVV